MYSVYILWWTAKPSWARIQCRPWSGLQLAFLQDSYFNTIVSDSKPWLKKPLFASNLPQNLQNLPTRHYQSASEKINPIYILYIYIYMCRHNNILLHIEFELQALVIGFLLVISIISLGVLTISLPDQPKLSLLLVYLAV